MWTDTRELGQLNSIQSNEKRQQAAKPNNNTNNDFHSMTCLSFSSSCS